MTNKDKIFLEVIKDLDFYSVVCAYIQTHTKILPNDIEHLPFEIDEIPLEFNFFIEFLGDKIDNLKTQMQDYE
jgi:hypothetical protein